MIKFKIKLTLKKYFTSNYIRFVKDGWKKMLIFIILGLIIYLLITGNNSSCGPFSTNDCSFFLTAIGMIISIVIFISLMLTYVFILSLFIIIFKYFMVRYYYKQEYMECFFDKQEFGWELADNKLLYKIKLIDYIKIYSDYILIQLNMRKNYLIFLADEKIISDVVKKLNKTNYKQYLRY